MIAMYILGLLEDDAALHRALVGKYRQFALVDGLDHLQVCVCVLCRATR